MGARCSMTSGPRKGSTFERTICRQLSRWVSNGARDDLFWRNVISGGQFTFAARKGKAVGVPGDLRATDPQGFEFLSLFMVECKHHKSIHLEQYLFDRAGTSPLAKIIEHARAEAAGAGLEYLLIAKQNQREAMVFASTPVGWAAWRTAHPPRAFSSHVLHNGLVTMMPISSFLLARPSLFLQRVRKASHG